MRQFIFIDNDSERFTIQDLESVKSALETAGLAPKRFKNIKHLSDFSKINADEAYDLLFSDNNCICTWSVYTSTHFGSFQQLNRFLRVAGSSNVKNAIYIDCSGMLIEALKRLFYDDRINGIIPKLMAIEKNYIIQANWNGAVRVRVDLNSDDTSSVIRGEFIDIEHFFSTDELTVK